MFRLKSDLEKLKKEHEEVLTKERKQLSIELKVNTVDIHLKCLYTLITNFFKAQKKKNYLNQIKELRII